MNPLSEGSEEMKKLYSKAIESKWKEVIKIYKENPEAHTAKITSSGDTVLHIAIYNGEESIVEALVAAACDTPDALKTKNELGNTPLHLAAYLGNAGMCRCIARCDTTLMGIRNDDNETPFFLAVSHGRKEAFHALHLVCRPKQGYNYCRGKEGDTILHSAISGDYFELAYYIMGHYQRLVAAVNEQGFTPLHLLANKPSAFLSGSHISGIHKLIYHLSTKANAERLQFKAAARYGSSKRSGQRHEFFPKNYNTFFNFVKLISTAALVVLGWKAVEKIRVKKAKHFWSLQLMESLLDHVSWSQYVVEHYGKNPDMEEENLPTPILIAAKSGAVEMVEGILSRFPVAINDMDSENKNVVLLAVEHRQPDVYKFLLQWNAPMFRKTDKDGNSALHLAARLGEHRPWLIPGAALQMQWEIKWYEFVRDSKPLHFFPRHNRASQTPRDIFYETHKDLVKEGGAWLKDISQSCSVVAGLIATVVFPNSATVPGGVKSDNSGTPTLQNEDIFNIYAISSLVAFCFSVNAVVMFLVILTSSYREYDFKDNLPRKLLVGLTSLSISIGCMLLSFCAGHFFVVKEKLYYGVIPMYLISCLPVAIYAVSQLPFYFGLVWGSIMRKVPERRSNQFLS